DVPTGDDAIRIRIGLLVRITGRDDGQALRITFDLMFGIVAVVNGEDSSPSRLIKTLQALALLGIGDLAAVDDQREILFALLAVEIQKRLSAEERSCARIESIHDRVGDSKILDDVVGNAVGLQFGVTGIGRARWNEERAQGIDNLLLSFDWAPALNHH